MWEFKERFGYETVRRRYSEAVGQRLVGLMVKENASFLYGLGTMKNEKRGLKEIESTVKMAGCGWKWEWRFTS